MVKKIKVFSINEVDYYFMIKLRPFKGEKQSYLFNDEDWKSDWESTDLINVVEIDIYFLENGIDEVSVG